MLQLEGECQINIYFMCYTFTFVLLFYMSVLLFSLFTCCNCLIRGLQSAPSHLMYLLTFGLIIYVWEVSAEW